MLRVDGKEYCSTKEAAARLGRTRSAIHDAIWRGALQATEFPDIPHRAFVEVSELERYAAEQHGNQGWNTRKAPGYVPNTKRSDYQRAYRHRKLQETQPTTGDTAHQGETP